MSLHGPDDRRRGICLRGVLILAAVIFAATAPARSQPARGDATEEGTGQSTHDLALRETEIVGLTLQGKTSFDRITIEDLDILHGDSGQRLLPLFHICRVLELPVTDTEDAALFANLTGDSVHVSLQEHSARIAEQTVPVPLEVGRSDLTGLREFWLPDTLLCRCLGLALEWNEGRYAYEGKTTASVPRFKRIQAERAGRSARQVGGRQASAPEFELPEMFPEAMPKRPRDPSIGILSPGVRSIGSTGSGALTYASLESWGRLARGEHSLRLRQMDMEQHSYLRLDEARWSSSGSLLDVNAGDVTVGVHDLIMPSMSMIGAHVSGTTRRDEQARSASGYSPGGRADFGSRQDFYGFAPLGSTVRLYLNDRLIEEQQVVETPEAPLGEGAYRFRGVNLMRGERNVIRTVVIEPDSALHEQTREIIGSDQLLKTGQVAFMAGAGTRRLPDEQFWYTQGQVAASRASVGVLSSMTFGPIAAYQKDHAVPFRLSSQSDAGESSRLRYPRESYHLGAEWTWRILDRNLLAVSAAGSQAAGDSVHRYAGRVSLTSTLGPLIIHPQFFHYGPHYFNGVHSWLDDRQGYAASVLWRSPDRARITLAAGQVSDNVDRAGDSTNTLDWQRAALLLPRVWKRTQVEAAADRLSLRGGDAGIAWSVAGRTMLPAAFQLSGFTIWGRDFYRLEGRELLDDLGIAGTPRPQRIGWECSLSRQLFRGATVAAIHSQLPYRQRTYLDYTFYSRGSGGFQSRLQAGYDRGVEAPFGEAQISYRLDRAGTAAASLWSRYQNEDWVLGASLSIQPTFVFGAERVYVLHGSRIDPRVGGLSGQVFLDRNGNGVRERGEPGIGGLEILTDSGQRIKTNRKGAFILPPGGDKSKVHLSLNPKTIPAFYDAVNGAQWAEIKKGAVTEVGLSVAILSSISGSVTGPDPEDTMSTRGLHGVRVCARETGGEIVRESVTAGDGSYYLGELKPGTYELRLDERTLPRGFRPEVGSQPVALETTDEPAEVKQVNFKCTYSAPDEEEDSTKPRKEPEIEYRKF